jgi:hypothetical protein
LLFEQLGEAVDLISCDGDPPAVGESIRRVLEDVRQAARVARRFGDGVQGDGRFVVPLLCPELEPTGAAKAAPNLFPLGQRAAQPSGELTVGHEGRLQLPRLAASWSAASETAPGSSTTTRSPGAK